MRKEWIVLAVVGGLLGAPAGAAATEFGGGSLGTTETGFDPVRSLVALRSDGTSLKVRTEATPRCPRGVIDHDAVLLRTTLKADGTFSRSATARPSSVRSVRLDISGSVIGNSASGQLTLSTSTKIRGKTRSCSTGSIAWQARAVITPPSGTGAPQPGAGYYGTTSQINASVPSAFSMRVSSDGARVLQAGFPYRMRCTHGSETFTEIAPPAKIASDGSFSTAERFTETHANVKERFRVDLSGRFAQGGALGSARVRSTRRNKRTGKLLSTCDTKSFSWAAIV